MWRKGNPYALLVGMQIDAVTVESSMGLPQKIKNGTASDPVITLLRIYLKTKTLIQKAICTPVFTAVLFTIAKIWKQPQCSPMDEWIKKLCYTYTMECYSAIKRRKSYPLQQHGWTIMESIMLSEISQSEKNK